MQLTLSRAFFILFLVLMLLYVGLIITESPDQKLRLLVLGLGWSSFAAGHVFN